MRNNHKNNNTFQIIYFQAIFYKSYILDEAEPRTHQDFYQAVGMELKRKNNGSTLTELIF